ncbi:MAG: glycosyltransferase family 2 protein [Candidatus Dojkabacteria bacterium]|nr:glycosyltransferase family 2 protein [Candidatus Dojkabacteria bacterium]
MKKISFVLPIYNEEQNIPELYKRLIKVTKQIVDKYKVEFVAINDGSIDKSLDELLKIHYKDERLIVVNFSRNFGQQAAITAGLDIASGDAVIIMDADLQDPPELSLDLIKKWEEGFDVVYAQRRTRKDNIFKKITAYIFYRLLDSIAEIKIPKDTGDFRLIDRRVVEALKNYKEKNRYIRGLVSLVGFKQTCILFDRQERFSGTTHYNFKKMIKLATDAVVNFSNFPIQLISKIGLVLFFLSILWLPVMMYIDLYPQNTVLSNVLEAIVLLITLIGSIILISLGIIGIYVIRIHSEVLARPIYIISSIYKKND